MAITDIQISEELETSAPSIKYRGDEGPKSPEEEMMMADALLKEEYEKYVYDLLEQRPDATPMSLEEFRRMVIGDTSRGPVLPSDEDPINPFGPKPTGPVLPDRQMAAYGGIMGMDGRKQYGIGSFLKSTVRKLIPNEIASVAEKAAPFVAPFNPLAAGLMKGIGGFDRTGSIGDSLKSGLLTYGGGQLARGIGGGMGNLQTGFDPRTGMQGMKYGFSNPLQGEGGLSALLNKTKAPTNTLSSSLVDEVALTGANPVDEVALTGGKEIIKKTNTGKIIETIKKYALDPKVLTGLVAGTVGASALMGNMAPDEIQDLQRGEGLDIEGIRAEVIEAMKDPSGNLLAALRVKYPFLGTQRSKNMAMGGRIGLARGGDPDEDDADDPGYEGEPLEIPDDADLSPDDFYGRGEKPSGIMMASSKSPQYYADLYMRYAQDMINDGNQPMSIEDFVKIIKEMERKGNAQGGRIGFDNGGGIMDLGGMEKDYRNTGGFVDIGEYEKKDDVPARLSVNEFVMTADAVRGMGDGNIDLGAKRMENLMGAMENKKGAKQMFDVSERLSGVV
jgi:hypothetical protein